MKFSHELLTENQVAALHPKLGTFAGEILERHAKRLKAAREAATDAMFVHLNHVDREAHPIAFRFPRNHVRLDRCKSSSFIV